jgi:membrane-associated phospholipid phosphatase
MALDYLHGLLRGFPLIEIASAFSFGVVFESRLLLAYSLWSTIGMLINFLVLKPFFEQVVYRNRGISLPFLGIGRRPIGARCCDSFLPLSGCQDRASRSYGMPSGHAQSAASFATFWTLYLLGRSSINPLGLAYLWSVAAAVSLSRLAYGCHTHQQVLVGNLIGVLFGLGGFFLLV